MILLTFFRRALLATVCALSLCFPMMGSAAEAYPPIVPCLPDVELYNGIGMVPAAPLVELLGGTVTQDKTTGSTTIALGGHVLVFSPAGQTALCDGAEVALPLQPYVSKTGILYVPVQVLVEGIKGTAAINADRRLFTITIPNRKDPLKLTCTSVTNSAALGKDDDTELYVLDLDGGRLRRLTYDSWDSSNDGSACLPVFIPNTDSIIYCHNGRLVQRTAKDPTEFSLPTPPDAQAGASFIPVGISADGKTLLSTQPTFNMAPVFLHRAGEAEISLVTDEGSVPALSPDGNLIVCLHLVDDHYGVYLMTPDGENRRRIEASASRTMPVFSQDGSMLAFRRESKVKENKVHWGMVIYRLAADNPGIISESPADAGQESFLAFSPDNQWVAISGSGLRVMRPDRSEAKTLATWSVVNPKFTVDGRQILFIAGTTLYSIGQDGKNMRKLLTGAAIRDYTFTPDGKQIILCAKPVPNGIMRQAEQW